jgi:hypothetical protein
VPAAPAPSREAAAQVPAPPALPPANQKPSPQEIARRSLPSVMLLVVKDKHSQPLALGTGFLVREGVVATNLHVVEGASTVTATPNGTETPIAVRGVLAADSDRDLALLRVEGLGAQPLALSTKPRFDIGEAVYAIGNPKGLQGTFSDGIVSSVRGSGSDLVLQITAPISPGSSGGPVLDSGGEVVGVATATMKEGQNLNFAVGAAALAALIERADAEPKPFATVARKKASPPGGESLGSAVSFADFMWDGEYDFQGGSYTVTIRNKLSRPIQNVFALVIFYDSSKAPLETAVLQFDGVIPGSLARMARGSVDGMIKVRVSASIKSGTAYSRRPLPGRVELRALDFQFAD